MDTRTGIGTYTVVFLSSYLFWYMLFFSKDYSGLINCEDDNDDLRKKNLRRPGIEPGSQEWESCMIPLHQRRIRAVLAMLLYLKIACMADTVT